MNPILFPPVPLSCHEAEQRLAALLQARGYHLQRAFDLDRAAADAPTVRCPHHGTARCTCRLVTLLVYANARLMGVLVLHGHDRRARLRWNPVARDAAGVERLLRSWARAFRRPACRGDGPCP